jgi:hypothetical protein
LKLLSFISHPQAKPTTFTVGTNQNTYKVKNASLYLKVAMNSSNQLKRKPDSHQSIEPVVVNLSLLCSAGGYEVKSAFSTQVRYEMSHPNII